MRKKKKKSNISPKKEEIKGKAELNEIENIYQRRSTKPKVVFWGKKYSSINQEKKRNTNGNRNFKRILTIGISKVQVDINR